MTETNKTIDGNLPDGTVAVVVVAAGSGERLGSGFPKAFVELGGQTLLERSVGSAIGTGNAWLPWPGFGRPVFVVAVVPGDHLAKAQEIVDKVVADNKIALDDEQNEHELVIGYEVVDGGGSRQESVAAGLALIPRGIKHVLVHDAARALAPPYQFQNVLEVLEQGARAVVPAVPVVDTIKQVKSKGEAEVVVGTLDRSALRAIQTPQGFELELLRELHASANRTDTTDDAGLAEQAGVEVQVVEGYSQSFKITTPEDLDYAHFVLSSGGTVLS